MRVFLLLLALVVSAAAHAAGEQFKGGCAYGLSEFGVDVKTDCSIRTIAALSQGIAATIVCPGVLESHRR